MYCFVIFQKRLRSVFDESSQTACFFSFCTTSNMYHYIPTTSHKTLTNHIPVFSGRITLSIGDNRKKIRAVVFEFFVSRQTRRRTLFCDMYRLCESLAQKPICWLQISCPYTRILTWMIIQSGSDWYLLSNYILIYIEVSIII